MDSNKIKRLLDSCFAAKNITETMEELPEGFKPRHIHTIDAISELSVAAGGVRVSDVSHRLNVTTPSVTKLINELEEKAVIEKYSLPEDKRVTLLRLTGLGKDYEQRYVVNYHTKWANNLSDVTEEEVEIVARVIAQLGRAMPRGGKHEQ